MSSLKPIFSGSSNTNCAQNHVNWLSGHSRDDFLMKMIMTDSQGNMRRPIALQCLKIEYMKWQFARLRHVY